MKKSKLFLIILLIVILFGGGIFIGWQLAKPVKTEQKVTADIILTTLHARGFLVTETLVFNEPITIENTEGSFWKDVFFGQTIEARGNMEVNLGVDLQKIQPEDIKVSSDKVTVNLPPAEIFNSRLVGPIDVENKQGILKRLLDSDDGYNQALTELTQQAEAAADTEELLQKANDNAVEEVNRLLSFIVKDKQIEVLIKEQTDNLEGSN
jgi:hypothetical protein